MRATESGISDSNGAWRSGFSVGSTCFAKRASGICARAGVSSETPQKSREANLFGEHDEGTCAHLAEVGFALEEAHEVLGYRGQGRGHGFRRVFGVRGLAAEGLRDAAALEERQVTENAPEVGIAFLLRMQSYDLDRLHHQVKKGGNRDHVRKDAQKLQSEGQRWYSPKNTVDTDFCECCSKAKTRHITRRGKSTD